ncbi:MAG: uracil-DNA glycosylase family protein [Acidiferrobacterales bacterium]
MDRRGSLRRQYLEAMGIQVWERRPQPNPTSNHTSPVSQEPALETALHESTDMFPAGDGDVAAMDWNELETTVCECVRCPLHKGRTQAVFGVGSRQAQWMFVGEAPGVEEDRQGEPFVGRAGQLLNAILLALGLKREDVYIANVLKCRPPKNRDPQIEEVDRCEPFLVRQIELIRPQIIVALGRHAAHSLLKTELPLSKLRGQRLSYHGIPLIVTYHTAYLLRNPVDKRKVWDDLCLARSVVGEA